MPRKLLVTAFGSFPGVEVNPSEILLNNICSYSQVNWEITFETLPVDYSYCQEWNTNRNDYDLVLHMGVAGNSTHNRIECRAQNKIGSTADVKGLVKLGAIQSGSPSEIFTQIPLINLVSDLSLLSSDAGSYLCNFVYFNSLVKDPSGQVLFLHIPPFYKIDLKISV